MISCRARLVTTDKTSLYHCDLVTKQQSMEWRHRGSPQPKKFRVQKSAGKVLASIFWDQNGILLIDYTGQHTKCICNQNMALELILGSSCHDT